MKHLAKLVAGIVLTVMPAMPAFATIPCQECLRSMPCCDGALCPTMARSRTIWHRNMKDAPAPCCKIQARSLVAVTDHPSIEAPISNVYYHHAAALVPASLKQLGSEVIAGVALRRGQRTQAVLSTFLI